MTFDTSLMKKIKNLYTVAEVAEGFGISRQAVGKLIQRYSIGCARVGRLLVLTNADIKELQERRMDNAKARGQFRRFGQRD